MRQSRTVRLCSKPCVDGVLQSRTAALPQAPVWTRLYTLHSVSLSVRLLTELGLNACWPDCGLPIGLHIGLN